MQARAFARSSPPASASSAARSAASASDNRLGHFDEAHGPLAERLELEAQRAQLGLEVPRLGGKVLGEEDDDGAGSATGSALGFFEQPLVQDALVRSVLVEDEELLSLLGDYAPACELPDGGELGGSPSGDAKPPPSLSGASAARIVPTTRG